MFLLLALTTRPLSDLGHYARMQDTPVWCPAQRRSQKESLIRKPVLLMVVLAVSAIIIPVVLLAGGCTSNRTSKNQTSASSATDKNQAFITAIRKGDNQSILKLLSSADVNYRDAKFQNRTFLHYAAEKGDMSTAASLVDQGADVNARDTYGQTPLSVAASNGQIGIMNLLLSKGVDINTRDNKGLTVLHAAALFPMASSEYKQYEGDTQILQYLLDKGLDVNARSNSGDTPLHGAAAEQHIAAAQFLLDHGADINARNNAGSTPLDEAIRIGGDNTEMTQLLRSRGGVE